jgi:polysaccharide pyruvyl transferase WcaK-like protein
MRLEELFGARDFVVEDPSKSIDTLIANKDRYQGLGRIYDEVAACDALVVDGDGDIVLSTPPRRSTLFILAMIELGQRLKKPVCIVNTMISDCQTSGRNASTLQYIKRLFAECRCVILRDPESLAYVQREAPEARSDILPDSLFAWYSRIANLGASLPHDGDCLLPFPEDETSWGRLDFSTPYICIGGGALAASDPQRSIHCYSQLVEAVKHLGLAVYLTENDGPDSFLHQVAKNTNVGIIPVNVPILLCGAVLANARLFISGRYHPTIFASLGGTPCIFLASHAHKMGSLTHVLEYKSRKEFSGFPDSNEIERIVSQAKHYIDESDGLRRQIREVATRRCEEAKRLPCRLAEELEADARQPKNTKAISV